MHIGITARQRVVKAPNCSFVRDPASKIAQARRWAGSAKQLERIRREHAAPLLGRYWAPKHERNTHAVRYAG